MVKEANNECDYYSEFNNDQNLNGYFIPAVNKQPQQTSILLGLAKGVRACRVRAGFV